MTHTPDQFTSPLDVRLLKDGRWMLLADLSWRDPSDTLHTVPAGEVTDFASVPKLLWWLAPESTATARAAVIHDYLYRIGRKRSWADDMFKHALVSEGVGVIWSRVYWLAVRMFGWAAYRKHRESKA